MYVTWIFCSHKSPISGIFGWFKSDFVSHSHHHLAGWLLSELDSVWLVFDRALKQQPTKDQLANAHLSLSCWHHHHHRVQHFLWILCKLIEKSSVCVSYSFIVFCFFKWFWCERSKEIFNRDKNFSFLLPLLLWEMVPEMDFWIWSSSAQGKNRPAISATLKKAGEKTCAISKNVFDTFPYASPIFDVWAKKLC